MAAEAPREAVWPEGAGAEAGFVRLELGVKEGNVASEKVAQKGGFEFEGIRPGRLKNHDGSYSNEMHYFFLNPSINYRKIGD